MSEKTKTKRITEAKLTENNRIIRIPYDTNDRLQWLELRRRGIGGSDAATVVGLNPWSSRLALYADKMGLLPEREDNEAMRQGRDFEDYVAKRWEEATGKKVHRVNAILVNEDYPWAFANLDRRVVGESAILEIKCTSPFNKHDFENGDVPAYYLVQCLHYIAVCDVDRAYLAVLVYGKGFYHYTIERNDDEIAALMEAESYFWTEHVQAKNPPEPDGSESAMEVLDSKVFVDDTELMMDADHLFDELERVSGIIKEYEDEKDRIKQQIIARMGNKARGQAQGWTATYLPQERTTIDRARLLKLYPQAYGDCVKTNTYRVFRSKKNKEASK